MVSVKSKILLVEPEFPIPAKSKNHSNFLPIGLLKLASFYRKKGHIVKLNRGNLSAYFTPDRVLITSLFTYWASYIKDAVQYYKKRYPNARIEVGGIYATLMPEHCKEYTGCDKLFVGLHKGAEACRPAYDLVDVDYQIIHGMRGCNRGCKFCGIWRIEELSFKNAIQIEREIVADNIIFYDNNMLLNPSIAEILEMLSEKEIEGRYLKCECQSGFDGRLLMEKPNLASSLKKAHFRNVRLAWDFSCEESDEVEGWIELLQDAGFNKKDIFLFMIYNWESRFEELEKKRIKCYEWGVQIADCRYRPLNQTYDFYNPKKINQKPTDYYISLTWTDRQVKKFRRNVRQHNICIRYGIPWTKYRKKNEKIRARRNTILQIV